MKSASFLQCGEKEVTDGTLEKSRCERIARMVWEGRRAEGTYILEGLYVFEPARRCSSLLVYVDENDAPEAAVRLWKVSWSLTLCSNLPLPPGIFSCARSLVLALKLL